MKVTGKKKGIVIFVAIVLVLILALITCTVSVPTGYTGIVTVFGQVQPYTLEAGFHLKTPVQNVVEMDNRTQKVSGVDAAFSSDIQQVEVTYSVNYNIDKNTAMDLYRNVGVGYYDTLIAPRLTESMKAAFSQYTADSLVKQRETLSTRVTETLKDEMSVYGIQIITVNIENIAFTDAFTNAVEAKQVAEQAKLQAQTEQEQATMEKEAEAERKVIDAQAEAEVLRIQAEAAQYAGEKEAEMNRKIGDSLTPTLVAYYQAKAWNGQLPTYVGGSGGTLPILDLAE